MGRSVMKDRLAELATQNSSSNAMDMTLTTQRDADMDEFFKMVTEVRRLIQKISSLIDDVVRKHSVVLSATNADKKTKDELEQLNNEIQSNTRTVRFKLKSMQEGLPKDENGNSSSVDQRIQRNQHSDLTRSFVEVMTVYSDTQVSFREKCKARIQRQLEITGKVTTDEELEEILQTENPAIFASDVMSDSVVTRQALNEIESRHQDIMQLERSIREMQEMFVDMAVLVETQGELINNIENNVTSATEYVGQAKVQTKKAVIYRKKAQRKHVIIAAAVLVMLSVIALVVGLAVGLPKS